MTTESLSAESSVLHQRKETQSSPSKTKTTSSNGTKDTAVFNDPREPYLLKGLWKRSIPGVDENMAVDDIDEPHLKRKHIMLLHHPEIKNLYGIEPRTKYICVLSVAAHLLVAYAFGRSSLPVFQSNWALGIAAYVIGGSLNQLFGVLIHEAAHGLIFQNLLLNKVAGLIVNIGLPVPIAASFRRYHLEHHAYMGVEGKDPDLPLNFELYFVRGNPIMKVLFLFFYPIMYLARGLALKKAPSAWEIVNLVWTISTNVILWNVLGSRGFLYLAISTWIGYGIHPVAAHFIQEHYSFVDGQETFSYYGGLNIPFLNVGYHNEHHDFACVPWSRLPQIKSTAPEFYEGMAFHTSWFGVHWNFVMDSTVGPQSRVGRTFADHRKGRRMIMDAKKRIGTSFGAMDEAEDIAAAKDCNTATGRTQLKEE